MNVTLLTSPTSFADMEKFAALAALTCHANTEKPYVPHEVLGRIIKLGHESILEHITLTYSVKGLSRACLQELARHRHISLSVESTRHTLKKNLSNPEWCEEEKECLHPVASAALKASTYMVFAIIRNNDISNDELKYYVPECWPTNLILTSNIRELRHILTLRTNPAALKEFQDLAHALFKAVPDQFKYLLEDCLYKENDNDNK